MVILKLLKLRFPLWVVLSLMIITAVVTVQCSKSKHDIPQTVLVSEKKDTTNLLTQLDKFPQLTKTSVVVDTIYKTIYKTSHREVVDTITEINRVIVPDTVKIIEDWTTERFYNSKLGNISIQSKIKYNRLEDISIKEKTKLFPYVGVGCVVMNNIYHPSLHFGVGYKNIRIGSQVLYEFNTNSLGFGVNLIYEFN